MTEAPGAPGVSMTLYEDVLLMPGRMRQQQLPFQMRCQCRVLGVGFGAFSATVPKLASCTMPPVQPSRCCFELFRVAAVRPLAILLACTQQTSSVATDGMAGILSASTPIRRSRAVLRNITCSDFRTPSAGSTAKPYPSSARAGDRRVWASCTLTCVTHGVYASVSQREAAVRSKTVRVRGP